MPGPQRGGNFQPARPRRRPPASVLPEGTTPIGPAGTTGKGKPAPRKPKAVIPDQYVGYDDRPDGAPGMVALCMLLIGMEQLVRVPAKTGLLVFAISFTLIGALGCYLWILAWVSWRRAWRFEWQLLARAKGLRTRWRR